MVSTLKQIPLFLASATVLLACSRRADANPCSCPKLWTRFESNCYRFFGAENSVKWDEAEVICQESDESVPHLVSIHSADEQKFVYEIFKSSTTQDVTAKREMWIGFNDQTTEGVFEWSDGTPNDFTNWKGNNPDNAGRDGEDCTKMVARKSTNWVDEQCSAEPRSYFLCKMPL